MVHNLYFSCLCFGEEEGSSNLGKSQRKVNEFRSALWLVFVHTFACAVNLTVIPDTSRALFHYQVVQHY